MHNLARWMTNFSVWKSTRSAIYLPTQHGIKGIIDSGVPGSVWFTLDANVSTLLNDSFVFFLWRRYKLQLRHASRVIHPYNSCGGRCLCLVASGTVSLRFSTKEMLMYIFIIHPSVGGCSKSWVTQIEHTVIRPLSERTSALFGAIKLEQTIECGSLHQARLVYSAIPKDIWLLASSIMAFLWCAAWFSACAGHTHKASSREIWEGLVMMATCVIMKP